MDILAAIDSFKGSASSFELNQAVLNGWEDRKGRKINVPIADGGKILQKQSITRSGEHGVPLMGWISYSVSEKSAIY